MYQDSPASALEELDRKKELVREALDQATEDKTGQLWRHLDLSNIYHDWSLEGQVLLPEELSGAFDPRAVADATRLPLFMSIRSHKNALEVARQMAAQKKLTFNIDMFRKFHAFFAGDPESAKTGRYRKDIPLHRSYFHEICHPTKISARMRKLITWMNDAESARNLHPIRWAAEFHFQFMRIFPFIDTTGKVGRTIMNLVLIRKGYMPAIIHATERQRYYETIRQSEDDLTTLIVESEASALDAAIKLLRGSAVSI
jgi:hypothetical protein